MGASSAEQVVAKVLSSVVTLQSSLGDEFEQGSGIVLTPDGLIMTNSHVVTADLDGQHGSTSTMVTFSDGRKAPFRLSLPTARAMSPLFGCKGFRAHPDYVRYLGRPQRLSAGRGGGLTARPGEHRYNGHHQRAEPTVFTAGDTDGRFAAFDAIQTDAALNPGNSGGALSTSTVSLSG